MLALLGFGMVACFMALIMTGRMSALVALVVVPIVFGGIAGHALDLGPMMAKGLATIAPTGALLMFAILYFSLMSDAGLFDPLVRGIRKASGGDPLRILIGTAVMGVCVALDGDGASTYVICVSALLPLYKRLGLSVQYMATLLIMSIGIMNILPWGGPTARAAAAMHVDMDQVFIPLIGPMLCGVAFTIVVATIFGLRERRRFGAASSSPRGNLAEAAPEVRACARPGRFLVNLVLTIALVTSLIAGILPLPILFIIATAVALMINYPNVWEQKERLSEHAANVLAVVSLIFAAGIFTGILGGTGMLDAMAQSILAIIPERLGSAMALMTAILSAPVTYFVTNDAFYFGMLPVLAQTAAAYGITPAEMARASLLGQPVHLLSPLVASTYLLVSLLDIDYGANQRASILWVIGLALVMTASAILLGVIPWPTW
ncbi:Citrate-proton symporter (plasmid) [Roseomonas mucosa]|uniref:CitMHS family transporter n=1 Tax=Roseomonas mucosa TaxID=207340 RepID=UPI00220B49DC|nr:citrate:proton symporter [Roseomonas mucosa]QDJ12239.1 Citrate-proton symporter [Roseomonas mucosa]